MDKQNFFDSQDIFENFLSEYKKEKGKVCLIKSFFSSEIMVYFFALVIGLMVVNCLIPNKPVYPYIIVFSVVIFIEAILTFLQYQFVKEEKEAAYKVLTKYLEAQVNVISDKNIETISKLADRVSISIMADTFNFFRKSEVFNFVKASFMTVIGIIIGRLSNLMNTDTTLLSDIDGIVQLWMIIFVFGYAVFSVIPRFMYVEQIRLKNLYIHTIENIKLTQILKK